MGAIVTAVAGLIIGYAFQSSNTIANGEFIGKILLIVAAALAPLLFILAFINIIAGWKMYKEKPGARSWGIIASIICLLDIPLGTALGVYGLWFLYGVEGKEIYGIEDSNKQ